MSLELFILIVAIALALVILFLTNNLLQFYVKYGAYVIITMSYSLLVSPICLLRPGDLRNVKYVTNVLRFIYKIFQINFEIKNKELLESEKPFIIVANHQSSIDFIVMMKTWPSRNCTPLAKKELLYAGPFGIACWLCGVTFINRSNRDKARNAVDKLIERIHRENMRIWVFPEGTRNASPKLLPFKKGAFHLAIQAKVPIIPIVTSSYKSFYDKEKKIFTSGTIRIDVLEPIQTEDLDAESVDELTQRTQHLMQMAFDNLNKDVNNNFKNK